MAEAERRHPPFVWRLWNSDVGLSVQVIMELRKFSCMIASLLISLLIKGPNEQSNLSSRTSLFRRSAIPSRVSLASATGKPTILRTFDGGNQPTGRLSLRWDLPAKPNRASFATQVKLYGIEQLHIESTYKLLYFYTLLSFFTPLLISMVLTFLNYFIQMNKTTMMLIWSRICA